MTWENGDKYEGHWKDDKKEGKGIFTWIQGEIYIGEWKNNQMTGRGTYTNKDGFIESFLETIKKWKKI